MRNLELTRDQGEMLVDLLEDCEFGVYGTWRHELAAEVRELFGMVSFEAEQKYHNERCCTDDGKTIKPVDKNAVAE